MTSPCWELNEQSCALKIAVRKLKLLKQNLGHNKIAITGKQRHYFQISKNLWSILCQNKPNLVPNKHPEV